MKDDSKNNSDCQTDIVFSVYVIRCSKTNMHCVGVTGQERVYLRIHQHKKGKEQFIDKEIRRIGWDDNFDWWAIETNVPANLITEREQYWIAFFDCVHPKGYNKTIGGIKFFKHSKKTCDKISETHRGKKRASFTEEHKANISKSRTGEKNSNYGKPAWNKGIPCPEEQKEVLREKALARNAAKRVVKTVAEENITATNTTPTSLSTLLDAVIFQ